MEKATYYLRAAGHRSADGGAQAAAAELGRDESVLTHPVAAALLGHYRATAGYALPAAEAFVEAAKLSPDETYAAAFWYEAGCLLQDKHEDERALAAFEHVAAVDITHRSVFARMRELLEARGANQRLASLISQRLARGGRTEQALAVQQGNQFFGRHRGAGRHGPRSVTQARVSARGRFLPLARPAHVDPGRPSPRPDRPQRPGRLA